VNPGDTLRILYHFFHARRLAGSIRSRADLQRHQEAGMRRFRRKVLARSPFYAPMRNDPFGRFPIMDKGSYLLHFDRLNTVGVRLEKAMETALAAERNRDFSPSLGGITVGMSSGTSGRRGVFLATGDERAKWAGVMLAKALPSSILKPVSIAFFLRANSNLYSTLNRGRHLRLDFHDLTVPMPVHVDALNRNQPDILTAPAGVLRSLAEEAVAGRLSVRPRTVFSVAEVLEPEDGLSIAAAFGVPVRQIYQCTEGFLGISGEDGRIVLNEEYVIVEKEWVDRESGLFVPLITDFTRSSQPIVRYRLDDVLVEDLEDPSPFTVLKRIEGRCDDSLVLTSPRGPVTVHADTVRQAVAASRLVYDDYRIIQLPDGSLRLQFSPEPDGEGRAAAEAMVRGLADRLGAHVPAIAFEPFEARDPLRKFRRITRIG